MPTAIQASTLRAGELRHRIAIESRASGQDALGQPNGGWSTFAPAWAAIDPVTGQEPFIADQFKASTTHVAVIRYVEGIVAPTMRITFEQAGRTRTFNIQAVLQIDNRRLALRLLLKELV